MNFRGTLVCRRKSLAIFDGRRGSFFRSPLRFQRNLRGPPSFRFQKNRKGGQKKNRRFFFSPSAVEIACDFRRQTRVLFFRLAFFFPLPLRGRGNKILPFFPIPLESEERPSPQIPLESEGTRSRKKRTNFPRLRKIFFPSHLWHVFPTESLISGKNLGEKNASRGKYQKKDGFFPTRVFYSFLPGTDQRSVPGRNRCFLRFLEKTNP